MALVLDGTLGVQVPASATGNSGAVAWVNWDGQTSPYTNIRASYNVSSITYNATGDYTVTLTNALVDTKGACLATSGYNYLSKSSTDIACAGMLTTSTAWYQNALYSGNRNAALCQLVIFR